MRILFIALGIAFVLPVAAQQAASNPTPATISADIQKTGAFNTLDTLIGNYQFDPVLQNIASGDKAWVALVPKFAPGTDDMSSAQLGIALASALPKSPKEVLAATDGKHKSLSVEYVCSLPFIDETDPKKLEDYRQKALKAVAAIQASDADRAGRCLKTLAAWQYKAPASP